MDTAQLSTEQPTEEQRPYGFYGAAAALLRFKGREALNDGPGGSGKTRAECEKAHLCMQKYPGARALFLRKTRVSMTQSILKTFEQDVVPRGHLGVGLTSRENRSSYQYPNGSEIVIAGMDEPTRIFSSEYDMIFPFEAIEFQEEEYESLFRALRNFKMPYQQIISDTNPGPPGHWLNIRAQAADDSLRVSETREQWDRIQQYNLGEHSGRMKRFISRHQDNAAYFDLKKWEFTQKGELYMQNLSAMSGHLYQRLKNGLWVAASGTVFGNEFSPSRNIVAPFTWPTDWPLVVYCDPGYDHPTAIVWLGVAPNGCIYVIDEIYEGGKDVESHAANIRTHNQGRTIRDYRLDPRHGFMKTAQSIKHIAEQYREQGIIFSKWPMMSGPAVHAVVNDIRQRLKAGMFKIFSTCTNSIMEMQTWSYKRTGGGALPAGDDAYEDRNNHAVDCFRGFVATNPCFINKEIQIVK